MTPAPTPAGTMVADAVVGADAPTTGAVPVTTLSQRSWADSQATMGYGTTRSLERVLASCGLLTSGLFRPMMCRKAGCCWPCPPC